MMQAPQKSAVHGARCSLMRGAMLLLAAACVTRPARADASADAACAAEAASRLEFLVARRGVADVAATIAAGCNATDFDISVVCDIRGSAGPCTANPACPEDQLASFGCTSANENDGCCFESFQQACEGCKPVVTRCLSRCDGPPPVQGRLERETSLTDAFCVDRADLLLPPLAKNQPDRFTDAGCDSANPGVTCDLTAAFSRCEDLPICAGAEVDNTNCTALTAGQSCCTVFLAPPCEGCEPEVQFCRQECLSDPPFLTGPPAPPGAPPVQFGAALVCSNGAASNLRQLAMINPDSFTVGCDGADPDPLVNCDIQSSVGSCEANPVCPADQIDQGLCTAENGPPECCDVGFARPCEGCDLIPLLCQNVCASNSPPPQLSAEERLNSQCIDAADVDVARLRVNSPGFLAPSCAAAEPGQPCDVEGTGGVCDATSLCSGFDVRLEPACSEPGATAESGCCLAVVAPPCPGCAPEPVECIQTCG